MGCQEPPIHPSAWRDCLINRWRGPLGVCSMAFEAAKWRLWVRHDHSWKYTEKLIRYFQTVSEGDFSEVRGWASLA